jgi:hypothetical protein
VPPAYPAFSAVPGSMWPGAIWPGNAVQVAQPGPPAFVFGEPYVRWAAGTPCLQWAPGEPYARWAAGSGYVQWAPGEPGQQWAAGSPVLT